MRIIPLNQLLRAKSKDFQTITHISLFAGMGGAESAIRMAGISLDTIAVSEKEQAPLRLYKVTLGSLPSNIGDITVESNWRGKPQFNDVDLVTAGFPCQPFSGMGENKGYSDPRVKAMLSMAEFLHEYKPKYVVFENVQRILHNTKNENRKHTLEFLSQFEKDYILKIHKGNPHDMGYLQTRGRLYIQLQRKDVPNWDMPLTTKGVTIHSPRQTWGDVMDKSPDKIQFKLVKSSQRIGKPQSNGQTKNWEMLPSSTKFNCYCAGTLDSRCSRGSWPQYKHKTLGNIWRTLSINESYRIMGYVKFPRRIMITDPKISVSSASIVFGNSWHVGHASFLFTSFPIAELTKYKSQEYYRQFINMKEVERLLKSKASKTLRSLYTHEELITTPIGNHRRFTATTSHKFDMKNGLKIVTMGMYLSPSMEASHFVLEDKGVKVAFTMCGSEGICGLMCLNTTGQMVTTFAMEVRAKKSICYMAYLEEFLIQLLEEITEEARKASNAGYLFQFRNNGTSDRFWERLIYMRLFVESTVGMNKFYDYTKHGYSRINSSFPLDVYHLTYSVDEKRHSKREALKYLEAGLSVSIVMHESDKQRVIDFDGVIDGDLSDHRPQDPAGSIVVLRSKGKARKKSNGFIKAESFVLDLLESFNAKA